MPIGKNAIKRVSNNGYSNVKTVAPDMENSIVRESENTDSVSEKKAPLKKNAKKAAPVKKAADNAKKPTPKKSMESEPELRPVKTLEKVTENKAVSEEKEGYTNLGKEMPYYLL